MKNITVEQTRAKKMRNCFVRKFVPIYQRTMEGYAAGAHWLSKAKILIPRYERGEAWHCLTPSPTSIPNKMWPIRRVRVRRAGQLELSLRF